LATLTVHGDPWASFVIRTARRRTGADQGPDRTRRLMPPSP
jgi:hypothetical protein